MGNSSKRPRGTGGGQTPSQFSILAKLERKYGQQGKEFLRGQSSYQKAKRILMAAINKNGEITHQRNLDLQYLEECIIRLQNHYMNQVAQAEKLTPNILQSFIQMSKQQPAKWTGFQETEAELYGVVGAVKCNYEKDFMKLHEKSINLISRTTIPEYELLSWQQKQELLHEFDKRYPTVHVEDFKEEIHAFKDILQRTQLESSLRKSEFAIALKFQQMRQLVHAKCYGCCVFLN